MTSPTTAFPMNLAFNWEMNGINYPIFKSPAGYVVPYLDFVKYSHAWAEKLHNANENLSNFVDETKFYTHQFEETNEHINSRYNRSIKDINMESVLFKVAFAIAAIVAIVLAAALLVVLL